MVYGLEQNCSNDEASPQRSQQRFPQTGLCSWTEQPPPLSCWCPVQKGMPGPGRSAAVEGEVRDRSRPRSERRQPRLARGDSAGGPARAIPLGSLLLRSGFGTACSGTWTMDGAPVGGGDGGGGGERGSAEWDPSSTRCSPWLASGHQKCAVGSHPSLGRAGE